MANELIWTIRINGTNDSARGLAVVESELKSTNDALRSLQKNIKEGGAINEKQAAEYDKLKRKQKELQNESRALNTEQKNSINIDRAKVGTLNQVNAQLAVERKRILDLAIGSKEFKTVANNIKNLETKQRDYNEAIGRGRTFVGEYGKGVQEGIRSMGLFSRELAVARGVTGAFSTSVRAGAKSLGFFKAALVATGIGALLVALGSAIKIISSAVKVATGFEKQMDKVAAITRATDEEIVALSNDAKRLGGITTKTASEVGQLQEEFAKLGFSTQEILNATEATIALSEASGGELAQSAKVAAATVRGFRLTARDTQRVVDVMASSFSKSALDLSKFEVAMAQVAPAAKASNVEIENATAMLGALVDAGLDASTAGTSLRNIFLENAKAGRTLDEGFRKIATSTNKNATAMELYGKRGAIAALVLADNSEKVQDLTEKLDSASGSAQEMADIMRDNLAGDVTILKSAWEGFLLSVEDGQGIFTRIARAIVQRLTNIIVAATDFRNRFVEQWNDLIKSSGIFRASIVGLGKIVRLNFIGMVESAKLLIEPFLFVARVIRDVITGQGERIRDEIPKAIDNIKKSAVNIAKAFVDTGKSIKDAFNGENIDDLLLKAKEIPKLNSEIEESTKQAIDSISETSETAKKKIDDNNKKLIDLFDQLRQARIDNLSEGIEKEFELEQLRFDREVESLYKEFNTEQQIKAAQSEQERQLLLEQNKITEQLLEQSAIKHQENLIDIQKKADEEKRKENEKLVNDQINQASQVAGVLSNIVGQSISDTQEGFSQSIKQLGVFLIDTIEKSAIAAVARATISSIALGPAGIARAAILTTLIKTATSAAKASLLRAETGMKIPKGHELQGYPKQGDNTLVLARPGEVILNQSQQRKAGGDRFFKKLGVPGFQGGGVIPGRPVQTNTINVDLPEQLSEQRMSEIASIVAGKIIKDTEIVMNETERQRKNIIFTQTRQRNAI